MKFKSEESLYIYTQDARARDVFLFLKRNRAKCVPPSRESGPQLTFQPRAFPTSVKVQNLNFSSLFLSSPARSAAFPCIHLFSAIEC